VIHQVGGFIRQFGPVVHGGGQGCLYAFFSHFLRNALGAAGIELRGIGTLRIGSFALS